MADDRNDMRGGPPRERPRSSDDRFGERGMGDPGGRGRDDPRRNQRGRDERGFFERAGDEISSWFWDDDSDQRGRRDGPGQRRPADGPMSGRDPEHRSSYGRERAPDQQTGRDPQMGQQAPSRGAWRSSEDQGDHQRGARREPPQQPWGSNEPAERGAYRPMAGDYGRSEQPYAGGGGGHFDRDSSWGREDSQRNLNRSQSNASGHDPLYQQWRQQQIEALDRDYEEYRREHQSKFENDFGSWRSNRQTRRQMLGQVREHMTVIGSDEEPVGTVDRVAGDRVILAKSDEAGGAQHSLSCSEIARIEENRVVLSTTGAQARNRWRDESRERALFEREDQGESGPHTLDRSFSGTYR